MKYCISKTKKKKSYLLSYNNTNARAVCLCSPSYETWNDCKQLLSKSINQLCIFLSDTLILVQKICYFSYSLLSQYRSALFLSDTLIVVQKVCSFSQTPFIVQMIHSFSQTLVSQYRRPVLFLIHSYRSTEDLFFLSPLSQYK